MNKVDTETTFRKDPKNPLNQARLGIDLDDEFMTLLWHNLDPFDSSSRKELDSYEKYRDILRKHPDVF